MTLCIQNGEPSVNAQAFATFKTSEAGSVSKPDLVFDIRLRPAHETEEGASEDCPVGP